MIEGSSPFDLFRLFRFQTRRRWSIVLKLFVVGLLGLNLVQTGVSLVASHYNYPGAQALLKLQSYRRDYPLHPTQSNVNVHIDVFAAENGVSRFLELDHWM